MTDRATVSMTIAASPQTVFEHLVEREKMLRWMGVEADLDPTPGGGFTLKHNDEATASGEFVEVIPHERVVFTWGWIGNDSIPPGSSTVEIDLAPVSDGTALTLTHTGLPDEQAYYQHGQGWTHFVGRLVLVAAGGEVAPPA